MYNKELLVHPETLPPPTIKKLTLILRQNWCDDSVNRTFKKAS